MRTPPTNTAGALTGRSRSSTRRRPTAGVPAWCIFFVSSSKLRVFVLNLRYLGMRGRLGHPRRRLRLSAARHAFRLRPAVNPREAVAAHVVLWQLVRLVRQGAIERDERIAAAPEHRQQVGHEVRVHLAGVDQEDLRKLAADDLHRTLLEEGDDRLHVRHVRRAHALAVSRLRVGRGEGVVGVVERDRGHAIAVAVEERLHAFLDLGRRTGEEEGMPEVAERLATRRERRARDRLALDDVRRVVVQRDIVDVRM